MAISGSGVTFFGTRATLIPIVKRSAKNRMPQVAVLLESSRGISRAMFQGILHYVRVYGPWSLNIVTGGANDQEVPDSRIWRGNGIIARLPNDGAAQAVVAARLPTVLINPAAPYLVPSHPLSSFSRIQSDSHAIGTLAAEHYLGLGFSVFAFIGAAEQTNWSRWRQNAFQDRLFTAGQSCHVYPVPIPKKGGWPAERPRLCAWLRKLPKPVAIFTPNDNRAREVLDACLIADISVPYEAAVLGVDNDIFICETCIPPLSSIAIDDEKAGYEAAQLLHRLMLKTVHSQQIVRYAPKGVVSRASTELLHVTDKRVIRALEFIRINSGLNIRVSDVAEHLGVTPRWAEKSFKQAVGRSLHQEIHATRLATVRTMVSDTDRPFAEIAARCGFRSVNHLCKLFKEAFGQTMSDARKGGS